MLRLTFEQARRSVGRLAAAGLAILIGTAFVTATLLASDLMNRTTEGALVASLAEADLVVSGGWFDDADLAAVADVPGVAVAEPRFEGFLQLEAGGRFAYQPYTAVPSDPRLDPLELTAGDLPAEGEAALPTVTAEQLDLEVGDTVTATIPNAGEAGGDAREPLRVSGLVADPAGAFVATNGALVATPQDARRWTEAEQGAVGFGGVLLLLEPGADLEDVRADIGETVATEDGSVVVRTRQEQAAHLLEQASGAADLMTALVLGFAAIALIVASLVIANTFAVLVAQRTHQLALLRCVGATARQLRRSVTLEALGLGVASSLAGIVTGAGLAQLALFVLGRTTPEVPLPSLVAVTPMVLLVPLTAGVVVTVLAARAPARAAARVSPLAAMRPADALSLQSPGSRRRLTVASLLTVGGLLLLGLGVLATTLVNVLLGLAIGILGGLLSFVGVLVGAVFWIPRLLGFAGGLLARRAGPVVELAAANTLRNPHRTAATSAALLIGVTLVAMMSTGAATARTSLDGELDRAYPVDLTVRPLNDDAAAAGVEPSRVARLQRLDGVATAVPLAGTYGTLEGGDEAVSIDVLGIDRATATTVVRDADPLADLTDGEVILPTDVAELAGIEDGATVTFAEESAPERSVEVTARVTGLAGTAAVATEATLEGLAPAAAFAALWVRLEDTGEAPAIAASVQELFGDLAVDVGGPALERAMFDRAIDALLGVVIGLLGVAVVIALVGVANTLSLSVIERRRESATLRAIGLTRRQLRQTLAVEGMLIAASGAVLGVGLGTLYGWAGAHTILGALTEGASLGFPWRDLVLVVVVAVLAGLLASVLPARGAARIAPAAALATE